MIMIINIVITGYKQTQPLTMDTMLLDSHRYFPNMFSSIISAGLSQVLSHNFFHNLSSLVWFLASQYKNWNTLDFLSYSLTRARRIGTTSSWRKSNFFFSIEGVLRTKICSPKKYYHHNFDPQMQGRVAKCHFFYTEEIFQINFYPEKSA